MIRTCSQLAIWVGILLLVSVQCRTFASGNRMPAAIIPGLGFFNKKEEEEQKDERKQQVPPLPPRPVRQQKQQGGGPPFAARPGQVPPRQQQHPMMDRKPLPPPPPQQRSTFEEGRRPLPPPMEEQKLHDGDKNVQDEEMGETSPGAPPDAPEYDPLAAAGFLYAQEEPPEQENDPLINQEGMVDGAEGEEETHAQQQQQQQQEAPPPPMWPDAGSPFGPYGGIPPPPGSWGGPPVEGTWGAPPPYDAAEEQWRMQQQQQQPPPYYPPPQASINVQQNYGDDVVQQLRQDLDDSLAREQDLLQEMQNLTSALGTLQSEDESHVQQMDMLTERVVEAEARAASERNAALEYRANCTDLAEALGIAQEEIKDWKEQCEKLTKANSHSEKRLHKAVKDLKARSSELEELALVIENLRLRDEHDKYLAERKKKKSGGLLGWLFGGFMREEDDEEEHLESAQELARSTLLRALQTERNNVEELENAVSMLQQNNSAISEVVKSRDSLINELNGRVAVFEEDKIVLKAALRQLQKEIKEEAPKTQKLVDDLKGAREENKDLKTEMESLIESHREEIFELQRAISQKQSAINDKESNLTMIGTYVDKLEERLGDFALARREIEIREEKCKQIEERAIQTERERDVLQQKVDEFIKEKEEFKSLLEDLAVERANSQREIATLKQERDKLLLEEQRLQQSIVALKIDIKQLDEVVDEWKAKVEVLELEIEELQTIEDELSAAEEEVNEAEDEVKDYVESVLESSNEIRETNARQAAGEVLAVVEVERSIVEPDVTKKEDSSSPISNLSRYEGDASEASATQSQEPFVVKMDTPPTRISPPETVGRINDPPPPPLPVCDESSDDGEERISQPETVDRTNDLPPPPLSVWDESSDDEEEIVERDTLGTAETPKPAQEEGHEEEGPGEQGPEEEGSKDEEANSDHEESAESELNFVDKKHNVTEIQDPKPQLEDEESPAKVAPPQLPLAPSGMGTQPIGRPLVPPVKRGPMVPPGTKGTFVRPQHKRRKVPFRRVRKAFSKATGIHGLFTPSSRRPPPGRGRTVSPTTGKEQKN